MKRQHVIKLADGREAVDIGHEGRRAIFKPDATVPVDEEIDLTKATLFADSSMGQYIPKYFADNVKRDLVTGVDVTCYGVLTTGPSHSQYWETWADVLDDAVLHDPVLGDCKLEQVEGDLWVIPVPKKDPETKVVLGHEFVPFSKEDWYGFAGADAGSLICHAGNTVLILSPDGSVSEFTHDEKYEPNGFKNLEWTSTVLIEG